MSDSLRFNQRESYRVKYPGKCPDRFLPKLYIELNVCRPIDICEKGVRFISPHTIPVKENEDISLWIKFLNSTFFEIKGTIVRSTENEVAVKLSQGIPLRFIYNEQIRLKKLESNGVIS